MQDLRQRAISGRKNSCRKIVVAQKLLSMQAMQQNSKVSCCISSRFVYSPIEIHTISYLIKTIIDIFHSLDSYMSHEGVLYCKPHHKELFQPKAVVNDILNEKKDVKKPRDKTQEILGNHFSSC